MIDGDEKLFGAADPVALEQLIDVGLESGDWEGLQEGGIFVHKDPAEDLGLEVGSTVEATFQNGEVREIPVAGIYSDAYLVGNWLMSSTMLDEIVAGEQSDFFVALKTADGVSEDEARQAIEDALVEYPQVEDRDRRPVQGLAGRADRPAARDHHGAARRSPSSSPCSGSRSPSGWRCSNGLGRSA